MRLVWILMLCGTVLTLPLTVHAQQAKVPATEGMSYNANSSMADNLKALTGKKVSIHLGGGKTLTGVVKEVGSNLVQLEKLEGKEFFDALVTISAIEAIDTRFRGF
ncbi:MAG: hypothetical protein AB9873_08365 [Syntrophobacteraceae bacterium]